MTDVPETVACPCGTGYAERLPQAASEPGPLNRRRVIHSYRHSGCHIGGQIVVEADFILRRVGPLFNPARFGVKPAEEAASAVAADGGEVVVE